MSYILSIYASFISSPIPLIISLIVHYVLQFLLSTLPHHILPSNPLLISNLFLFMSTFSVVTSFTYFYFITLRYHLFFLHVLTHSYCPSPILPPSSLLPFVPFSLLPFLPSSLSPFFPSSLPPFFPLLMSVPVYGVIGPRISRQNEWHSCPPTRQTHIS
jgi:hypothetical protein